MGGRRLDVVGDLSSSDLRKLARKEDDGRVVSRLLAIASALDGLTRVQAAKQAGMDRQTLADWVPRYNKLGIDGLRDKPKGHPKRLLTPGQEAAIKARVLEGPDPEKTVASQTPAHAAGKPIEVWFCLRRPAGQDEARVGQKGTLTYVWGLKGSRPRAAADQRYACAYIFGALCPAKGTGAALVLPFANTDAMNQHLLEISRHVTPGSHAIIIIDGAGWHTAHALKIPDNITLIKLPPYSPELNSQENIWQYLRQNHLANPIFDTYTDIVDACRSAWNALIALPKTITSIGNRDWINAVNS